MPKLNDEQRAFKFWHQNWHKLLPYTQITTTVINYTTFALHSLLGKSLTIIRQSDWDIQGVQKNFPYSEAYNSAIYWVRIMKLVSFERIDSQVLFWCHNFVCWSYLCKRIEAKCWTAKWQLTEGIWAWIECFISSNFIKNNCTELKQVSFWSYCSQLYYQYFLKILFACIHDNDVKTQQIFLQNLPKIRQFIPIVTFKGL